MQTMSSIFGIIVVAVLVSVTGSPIKRDEVDDCLQLCHPVDPSKINVHLIPHSHDDVGWKKTVNQYFDDSVLRIISTTVEALKANSDRRFIQVETAYFWLWWESQTESVREDLVNLVNNGQIEIINAAWSMNDEASTNYQSIIDQFTWGIRTINDTIGRCGIPRIGWQIDPFGHSNEQASIFAQLGYDAVFFARIAYQDKEKRKAEKNLELIWQGSGSLGNRIFTSIFPDHYHAPGGFCFDVQCGDPQIIDDETSPDYNLPDRVAAFADLMTSTANFYKTSNVIITMGADFQYEEASKNFNNMDKLIAGFSNHETINVIYSTPSCYLKAVNEEAVNNGIEFSLKTDDFFPYASDSHSYWTGYFTSHPSSKRFERVANNFLQTAKQLVAFSRISGEDHDEALTPLRQAMGVMQHHDAITGTSKRDVVADYTKMIFDGINQAQTPLSGIILDLLKKEDSQDLGLKFSSCLLANVSVCDVAKSERFVIAAYNPLGRTVTEYLRIPVTGDSYKVTGSDGVEEIVDVVDNISDFSYVEADYGTPSPKELVFASRNLPPLGLQLYYVEKILELPPKPKLQAKFGTETLGFEIDDATGLLKTVTINSVTLAITQKFLYYQAANGDNNGDENRASGAYIFRPKETEAISLATNVTVTSTVGNLVDEVRQEFNEWVTQIIRVYKGGDESYIEFDWLVGPIEVDEANAIGREVISRFTIENFDNSEIFFTDSNGRELIKRQLNTRSDYDYDWTLEPVSSNYYPVTSEIVIKDEEKNLRVAILNDRAQGGSSLDAGVVELMVHRRLLKDDGKGVDEALNESEFGQGVVVRGQHFLTFGPADNFGQERGLVLRKLLPPLVFLASAESPELSLGNVQDNLNFQFSALARSLPEHVHILTLEPWKNDSLILRLEHILAAGAAPATVDLQGLFTLFEVVEIREMTLGANQWLGKNERQKKFFWNLQESASSSRVKESRATEITLDPMQIRTFVITTAATV